MTATLTPTTTLLGMSSLACPDGCFCFAEVRIVPLDKAGAAFGIPNHRVEDRTLLALDVNVSRTAADLLARLRQVCELTVRGLGYRIVGGPAASLWDQSLTADGDGWHTLDIWSEVMLEPLA